MTRLCPVLLAVALLAGCAAGDVAAPRTSGAVPIEIRALPGANDGAAVAVDVVAAWSDELAAELDTLAAEEWFATRPRRLVEGGDRIAAFSFEVPPGTLLKGPQAAVYTRGAVAVFVFAGYFDDSRPRRARAAPGRPIAIELGVSGMRLRQP